MTVSGFLLALWSGGVLIWGAMIISRAIGITGAHLPNIVIWGTFALLIGAQISVALCRIYK